MPFTQLEYLAVRGAALEHAEIRSMLTLCLWEIDKPMRAALEQGCPDLETIQTAR